MKKYLYSFVVIAFFVIGFGASTSASGTYYLEGGYVLTIDKDDAVRLKTPDGKIFKGKADVHAPIVGDVYADISFSENVKIMHIKECLWVIDKDIQYLYEDGILTHYWESKDEDHRIKIVSYSN